MMKHAAAMIASLSIVLLARPLPAAPILSDESDGPFNPVGVLVTVNVPADGVFNFTTINIPAGVRVKFNRHVNNTPVYFCATGDVTINGTIDVSATATNVIVTVPENPKRTGGPGGGDGGPGGTDASPAGGDGQGPGGGKAGLGGGGGGCATAGSTASRYSWAPGAGGAAGAFPVPLRGGSGGGGGGAINHYGWYSGGYGGGAGGAIQVATPGAMTIGGDILANGANGGWTHTTVLAHAGPGGGGSGGCIDLYAGVLTLEPGGRLQAVGGYGGGLSTQPYSQNPAAYSSGADGGLGYVRIEAGAVDLAGDIQGESIVVPEPATVMLLSLGVTLVGSLRRRARRSR